MSTRVSTGLLTSFALDAMLRQQADMSETQLQITTGKRLLSPADDPYGSARAINLKESTKINEQYQVNIQYAENRLATEEGVLQGLTTAIQRIRELAVNANNDSQSIESRRFIREEILRMRDQLLDLANTTDSSNEYIFAGFKGKTKPFSYNSVTNDYEYSGDDGQRQLKIGTSTEVAVNDDGLKVFMQVKQGNGTFATSESSANQGTGVIDPGRVQGTFYPGEYTIKFMPATSGYVNDPHEYYVVNEIGEVIVAGSGAATPGANLYANEAAFFAAVNAGTETGVLYEAGSTIAGLEAYGIQTSIDAQPAATGTGSVALGTYAVTQQDTFTIRPSGNQNMFKTVQNFIDSLVSLQTDEPNRAHFHNSMNRVLADLDQALGSVLDARARVGARLNTVQKQTEINESFNLQMKQTLSQIEDLDYASAITRLNLQLTALQASQQTYQKIQGLSLFNYL